MARRYWVMDSPILPAVEMDDAEIVERLRIGGTKRERLAGRRDRLVEPSCEAAHLAEIAMIERHAPVGSDRLAHKFDRDRRIAGLMRDDAEKMERLGMAGHRF